MRLTSEQIAAIKEIAAESFGRGARVYLFGSRINDDECERHLRRLRYAAEKSEELFPLSAERYQNLLDPEVAGLGQMLFCFGKLQDAIGQRLLPAILLAGQEWQDDETFLDKRNWEARCAGRNVPS